MTSTILSTNMRVLSGNRGAAPVLHPTALLRLHPFQQDQSGETGLPGGRCTAWPALVQSARRVRVEDPPQPLVQAAAGLFQRGIGRVSETAHAGRLSVRTWSSQRTAASRSGSVGSTVRLVSNLCSYSAITVFATSMSPAATWSPKSRNS